MPYAGARAWGSQADRALGSLAPRAWRHCSAAAWPWRPLPPSLAGAPAACCSAPWLRGLLSSCFRAGLRFVLVLPSRSIVGCPTADSGRARARWLAVDEPEHNGAPKQTTAAPTDMRIAIAFVAGIASASATGLLVPEAPMAEWSDWMRDAVAQASSCEAACKVAASSPPAMAKLRMDFCHVFATHGTAHQCANAMSDESISRGERGALSGAFGRVPIAGCAGHQRIAARALRDNGRIAIADAQLRVRAAWAGGHSGRGLTPTRARSLCGCYDLPQRVKLAAQTSARATWRRTSAPATSSTSSVDSGSRGRRSSPAALALCPSFAIPGTSTPWSRTCLPSTTRGTPQ